MNRKNSVRSLEIFIVITKTQEITTFFVFPTQIQQQNAKCTQVELCDYSKRFALRNFFFEVLFFKFVAEISSICDSCRLNFFSRDTFRNVSCAYQH